MTKQPRNPPADWWKNKPRKGDRIYATQVPMPGTKRMRRRALFTLKAEKVDINHWHVTGGGEDHIVTNFGKYNLSCDCAVYTEGAICSHVIKVMYETRIIPRKI